MPTRYFTDTFSMTERWEFIDKYSDAKWDFAKSHITHRDRVSKSAIYLVERVEQELGIKLFPVLIRIACKGFDISGGTHSFSMIDDKQEEYYFDCRASYYTQKRMEIYMVDNVISVVLKQ